MRLGGLSFDKGPVTSVVLVAYVLILFLVFWTDVLPNVPKDQEGLNLQDAYADLHHVRLLYYNRISTVLTTLRSQRGLILTTLMPMAMFVHTSSTKFAPLLASIPMSECLTTLGQMVLGHPEIMVSTLKGLTSW